MYRTVILAAGLLLTMTIGPTLADGQQVPAPFRSAVTLVPVDVRVIDLKTNKPVNDLTGADFTVFEDGVRQAIRHFSRNALTPEAAPSDPTLPVRQPLSGTLSSKNRRTFLIVLGRGRIGQPPQRGVEALIHFVRQQLLPQDHVAVVAYNRATDFTTDHEKVAQVLERFASAHYAIDMLMTQRFSGLAAVYGSKTIPSAIQNRIDAVFQTPQGLRARNVQPTQVPRSADRQADTLRTTEALQRGEIVSSREIRSPFDQAILAEDARYIGDPTLTFQDYVAQAAQTAQDVASISAGIEYLRHFEGEKHLIYVTPEGLFLPRLEDDYGIAALANDARVVVDTIIAGIPTPKSIIENADLLGSPELQRMAGGSTTARFAMGSVRNVGELTGGRLFQAMYARDALDRINSASMSGYLLGYYPPDTSGREFRRISVTVNRQNVLVLFRHGYYARSAVTPVDRQWLVAYNRIAAAGAYDEPIRDIRVAIKDARVEGGTANKGTAVADVKITLPKACFRSEDDRQVSHLDVSVFCGDSQDNPVGEAWQTIDLRLKSETYERALREGVAYTARAALKAHAGWIKVVVYNPTADIVGSEVARVR